MPEFLVQTSALRDTIGSLPGRVEELTRAGPQVSEPGSEVRLSTEVILAQAFQAGASRRRTTPLPIAEE